MTEPNAQSVFFDPTKRRARHFRRAGWLLAMGITILAVAFIASVLINPVLPRLRLHAIANLPNAADAKVQPP